MLKFVFKKNNGSKGEVEGSQERFSGNQNTRSLLQPDSTN